MDKILERRLDKVLARILERRLDKVLDKVSDRYSEKGIGFRICGQLFQYFYCLFGCFHFFFEFIALLCGFAYASHGFMISLFGSWMSMIFVDS